MAKMGDLIAKLASGQELSPGEIEALRRAGNNADLASARSAEFTDQAGRLLIPGVWTRLYDKTVDGELSEFVVGLPSAYRHLRVVGTLRSNGSSGGDGGESLGMQMNGDTNNNYFSSRRRFFLDASSVSADATSQQIASTFLSMGAAVSNDAPANHFGSIDYFIPNYYSNVGHKTIIANAGYVLSTSPGGADFEVATGHWASPSPITSLRFWPAAHGNAWITGSRLTVYGLSE